MKNTIKHIRSDWIGLTLGVAIFLLTPIASLAAIEFESDSSDWKMTLSGNANAHYVFAACDSDPGTVHHNTLLCTGNNANSVGNGYLPTSIEFGLSTHIQGYDVKTVFAVEQGTVLNAAFNGGGAGFGDDISTRAYLELANESMGTILAGRHYGVYGLDIILNDMTLIGYGASGNVKSPLNTSFGGAGYGYIFVDRISQITWTAPLSAPVDLVLGIYQPLDLTSFTLTGGGVSLTGESGSELPGVHGKLRYNFGGGFVSSSFITQSVNTAIADFQGYAVDITGSYSFGDANLVGSYYTSDGGGYSGLFTDAADSLGVARESDGFFLQGKYTLDKTTYGLNYGVTYVDRTANDPVELVEKQEKFTGGIYYSLIPGVTLLGEYSRITVESHAGAEINNDAYNAGVIVFF